jgi:hypothetical protein
MADMGARGDLRHDTPIGRVRLVWDSTILERIRPLPERSPAYHRGGRLVARGFDAKDTERRCGHEKRVTSSLGTL